MNIQIPFNKPCLAGNELQYIQDAITSQKLSGNGKYTQLCQELMEQKYSFGKCLLTTSCTDALEMAAILMDIQPGDEIIMPSYTFVSTANAFVLRGAKIIFCDSRKDHPGMDEEAIEGLMTDRTKAIVIVHYAGVACDMEVITQLIEKYNIFLVEDAAQAIDNYYIDSKGNQKALGSFGHFATFSFHETKNIIAGEGGMLIINDSRFYSRAEIIWEKGTNRAAYFRGEVNKYGWVDVGSSFLPSELIAAFLYAQLEALDKLQNKRKEIWKLYYENLKDWAVQNHVKRPFVPAYSTNNAHMFYLILPSLDIRQKCIDYLKNKGILTVFHYLSLHESEYYHNKHDGRKLPMSNKYTDYLLRFPLYNDLTLEQVKYITDNIIRCNLTTSNNKNFA